VGEIIMNAKSNGKTLLVTVSRRNLLTLLQKVDLPAGESHCAISRICDNGLVVVLKAETDAAHYGDREAGQMRNDAEAFVKESAHYGPDQS
jgi:hypothetical protein